jgi:hypothetical protein
MSRRPIESSFNCQTILAWVHDPSRVLAKPWFVDDVPTLYATVKAQTPKAFARHGVFLAASELASV